MKIYLLRHGETSSLEQHSSLSKKGHKTIKYINEYLYNVNIDLIYSSPQKRAIESIEQLSKKIKKNILIDNRLKEFIVKDTYVKNYRELLISFLINPNKVTDRGESLNSVDNRLQRLLYDIEDSFFDKTIVISTHGVCSALILSKYYKEAPLDIWKRIGMGCLFELDSEKKTVSEINRYKL